MVILKLNKTIFFVLVFFALACQKKKLPHINDYISCGHPFWISFKNFDDFSKKNIQIKCKEKQKFPKVVDTINKKTINLAFTEIISLSDTLEVIYKDYKWKIYGFKNIQKEVVTQYPKKEIVCVPSSVIINGVKQKEEENNAITIDFLKNK